MDCLENPEKIDGVKGEELGFATGLIYKLSSLQAVIRLFDRYLLYAGLERLKTGTSLGEG